VNTEALFSSENGGWGTPPEILDLVRAVAMTGEIGMDPATSPDNPCRAVQFYTPETDGLFQTWGYWGLVYVNPPYGRGIGNWTSKMRVEGHSGTELIALLPARTDTAWWQADVATANAICFWRGRIKFVGAAAGAPFPSALAYWGNRARVFERVFADRGWLVRP